eukprot:CAMPEP_0198725326 /NCGR_PEP_ID=MMETSP1475-20131203/2651_1 /TAXON_ID= ORGANISM="Unidentified sp., Strain CCMP1999" /NCGR_SAMPLE_ID=MMETSP1475 /ASSEMBLY_ACC=CAM_ASM_001111 /LENGTH=60 /DNA_ID=CAMNT_0044487075 /DNA_START=66 /DNA_END=245 /DNA_ORIENTATION=+
MANTNFHTCVPKMCAFIRTHTADEINRPDVQTGIGTSREASTGSTSDSLASSPERLEVPS